jgi:hypothetical protein
MNWKAKFFILLILAVPAFTGYPVASFDAEIFSGITYGWALYFLIVNGSIAAIIGKQLFPNAIAIAALIALPVVFVGAGVSYLIFLLGLGYESGPPAYSAHYVSLCLTMLTVIPLALSLVAILPFQDFEQNLLTSSDGVSKIEKFILMILRVFNHIVYFVIPDILETMREEGFHHKWTDSSSPPTALAGRSAKFHYFKDKLGGLMVDLVHIAVEGICASIQFIPLWAVEISQLPQRNRSDSQRTRRNTGGRGNPGF